MKKSYVRYLVLFAYISLLGFNIFMLYFLGSYFNLIFLSVQFFIPLFTYLDAFFLKKHIKMSIQGATIVDNRRDNFIFSLTLSNNSLFFANNCTIYINIANRLFNEKSSHSVNIPVNPFLDTAVTYPVSSSHCGVININVEDVVINDLLNIFSFHTGIKASREIVIMPDNTLIDDILSYDFSQGYTDVDESTFKGNDGSEVSDIREYIPGDSLKDIHWKLSAKKQLLMVKEHMSVTSARLLFYIELADNEEHILDSILDYAYGIGTYLCSVNTIFSLMWFSSEKNDCIVRTVTSNNELTDTIMEILYESPVNDYMDIRNTVKVLSGHENFITIGVDYVLEQKQA